jgi:hypothetical protein
MNLNRSKSYTRGSVPIEIIIAIVAIAMIGGLVIAFAPCGKNGQAAQTGKHQDPISAFLVANVGADASSIKMSSTYSCGTIQTEVVFQDVDAKSHTATFNGDELKYLDGQPYMAQVEKSPKKSG